jgi:hypothetical protein
MSKKCGGFGYVDARKQGWDSCGSCRTSALVPTRQYSVQEAARGRPDTMSDPEVTSEHVCPIPTEIYVGYPRFTRL